MANQEQLAILKQGVEVWNKWREDDSSSVDLSGADLSKTDLSGANLMEANLSKTNLREAELNRANLFQANLMEANLFQTNLSGADLWGVDLVEADLRQAYILRASLEYANLSRANFSKTDLSQANLSEAYLSRTNLSEADLFDTNFSGVDFIEVNFSRAVTGGTIFGNTNLSDVIGLDEVHHEAPSIIDTKTLQLSKGKIPIAFLRGCGLSDLDIEYTKLYNPGLDPEQVTDITYKIHELYLRGGIQYYSCFISYSSKDHTFAQRLYDDLQTNGVRCWFDREDLRIGDPIRPTIDRQIRLRDKLLVVLSENSIQSEWVGDEVEGALEEEQKSKRSVLFPIRLDDAVLNAREDWTAKIKRRRHVGDFSEWQKEENYKKAFERLLRDLKASGATGSAEN